MSEDLWSFIVDSLKARPQKPAWVCRLLGGKRRIYRYGEIYAYALDLAAGLREQGVGAGDMVGILSPNGPEWGVAAFAAWKLGAVVVPVHTAYGDVEMAALLDAVRPKLILAHGVDRRLDRSMNIQFNRDRARIAAEEVETADIEPNQEAVRSYTSGSTGKPKIVRLSHHNIISNVRAAAKCCAVTPRDRFLSLLPLSHMMELTGGLLLPLYSGATIVVPRVLAANEILEAMAAEKITAMIAVPRLFRNMMLGMEKRFRKAGTPMVIYRALLKKLPVSLRRVLNWPIRRKLGGRIKAWISGGSRLDPEIARYFRDLGLPLRQGYGLTETSPVVSLQVAFEPVLDSVGKPLAGAEIKIHEPDETGSGELWVRGPHVMLGYADEKQTREAMQDGWFKTGDLARIDEHGNIVLTGRSKRLIVTEAGKNVYPEELETLLERIPEVKEAGVLEVDMQPAAVVAVEGTGQVKRARRILKEFNSRVAAHNRIKRFALVDELPRTPIGKVALKELPEIFSKKEITE